MHKHRIDLLEDLAQLSNKVFYMNIVREVLYELGMAYTNILDIKLEAFEQGQKMPNCVVNPFAFNKIERSDHKKPKKIHRIHFDIFSSKNSRTQTRFE